MTDNRTLIAYGSKMGATEETASEIASVLREKYRFEVDVVDLKKNPTPDLTQYRNIVIGSGVRIGSWNGRALKFLHNEFEGKKVAVFVSSMMAGNPNTYDGAFTKFIKDVLGTHARFEPVATAAFGGRLKILGMTLSDNRDTEKIRAWADELGKKLS